MTDETPTFTVTFCAREKTIADTIALFRGALDEAFAQDLAARHKVFVQQAEYYHHISIGLEMLELVANAYHL